MQKSKTIITIFLLLTFATSMIMTTPQTQAQTAPTMKTYPSSMPVPNPVGVGQETLLRFGIIEATGDASYGWTGITVTVTKPDGVNETLGPFTTDSTGGTATVYTPNKVGTYKANHKFPSTSQPSYILQHGSKRHGLRRHNNASKHQLNEPCCTSKNHCQTIQTNLSQQNIGHVQ